MSLVKLPSIITHDVIDRWDKQIDVIEPMPGIVNINGESKERKDIRDCTVRRVNFTDHPALYKDIANEILSIVDATMSMIRADIYRTIDIQHTTYNVGNFYTRHMDHSSIEIEANRHCQRKISMVVMISDPNDYDGGDLVIGQQAMPKQKGSVVLFNPKMFHEVKPVTRGTRKSLVVWVLGPNFK